MPPRELLTIGQCATLACLWEVCAPKVGNVHRGADFDDATFGDFAASAVAIGPAMQRVAEGGRVGRAVREAIEATRSVATTNTNLGMVLLLAPLAAVPRGEPLERGVASVLGALDADDAAEVYAAIRLAAPGGLGKSDEADVAGAPPASLIEAMRMAADRDLVARQYARGYREVFGAALPWLLDGLARGGTLSDAIVDAHVRLMAAYPDTLIARKCGPAVAEEAAARAARAIDGGPLGSDDYHRALAELDFWLRSDGRRRNPGTSADLLAAALFAALREGRIELPARFA